MQYRSRICPAGSRKVLGIMPTELIKNKHLKEILLFVSIKLKNWQQPKTKTPTLEQHNRLIEIKMIQNVLLSYCVIQGIHLIKKILLWILIVSYGSSFAICKTCFLHISTKLYVHIKKAF